MGLKNKLNKMKNFLFDEEEDYNKSSKKSNKSLKEEKEDFSNTVEIEELYFEDEPKTIVEEKIEPKSRVVKNETEFNFPEFDDDDFMIKKKPEPLSPIVKEEVKPVLYQGSKRKEETKRFKPSPIISPIYGLLDKEGNTVKKNEKTKEYSSLKDEVSLEDVRKKAYGNISENLENTITRLSKKTIEEAEKDMEEEEKLFGSKEKEIHVYEEDPIVSAKEDDDDDMLLPNINFKEIDVDIEKNKKANNANEKKESPSDNFDDDDYDDTKEQDLFNLIDSMYQKEGNEE